MAHFQKLRTDINNISSIFILLFFSFQSNTWNNSAKPLSGKHSKLTFAQYSDNIDNDNVIVIDIDNDTVSIPIQYR